MKTAVIPTLAFLAAASPVMAMTGAELKDLPQDSREAFMRGAMEGLAIHDKALAPCVDALQRGWEKDAANAAIAFPRFQASAVAGFYLRYTCGKD